MNAEINFNNNEKKRVHINILGRHLEINFAIRMRDLTLFESAMKEGEDSKTLFLTILYDKIIADYAEIDLSKEDLLKIPEEELSKIIELFAYSEQHLKVCYEQTNKDLPSWDRFSVAIKAYIIDIQKRAKASVEKISENVSANISEGINNILDVYNQQYKHIQQSVQESIEQMRSIYNHFQSNLSEVSKSLLEAVKNYINPDISEETKLSIANSYGKWGEYGWTIDPNLPPDFYFSEPSDISEANNIMKGYYNKDHMNELFDELRLSRVNHKDLEEAIDGYESRRYKSCALIIFGLIDSAVIRKQKKPKNGKEYRPTGKAAIHKIIEEQNRIEMMWYMHLRLCNLESCANVMFRHGKDFRLEDEVINRNFVSHGMSKRAVRKRDCIQLFLILINILWTI